MSFFLESNAESFFSRVCDIFKNIGAQDIIDIILLALLLLLSVTVFKGKRGWGMLICVCISVIALFLTGFFALDTLNSVFSGLVKSGTVIAVIIFQPEIRDFLEKIGNASKGFRSDKKPGDVLHNVINNVCKAVGDMSSDGTGALIVMELSEPYNDFVQEGVELNADVSSQLLENIFVDKTPLHDGAVMITNCKIRRACCLLHLPRRSGLEVDLGSRHSAAVGVSVATDAIAIVVSEETGVISVAFEGKLTRNYTAESLRRFLIDKLIGKEKEEDGK